MKKRGFLNLCVVAAALSVTAGTLYSCKDYDDEIYAEMNGMNSTLSGQIATQEEGLAALKAELEQTKADNAATKEVLQNSIDEINKVLNSEDNGLVARIIALENAQAKVAAQLETIGKKVDENFNVLSGDIADLAKKVAANEAAAKANEALIKETEGALKKDIEANAKAVKEQGEKLDQILTELGKAQTDMNAQIAEVKESVAKLAEEHKADIEKLNGDVKALTEKVDANTKALEEMGLKLDKLSEKVSQMVTSVLLNGAYSPVVGYFSLPTGLKSNILAAYYGSAEASDPRGVVFPAASFAEVAGALKGEAFTKNNGDPIVGTGANAGKVYVTVNPSSVDMTNKTFSLVNSLGEVSPVSFGKAVESKDKLAFGYTRAAGNKNFYEIPATLDSARIADAKLRVEIEELKEVMGEVKTAIENRGGLDVTKLASTLFKCVNDLADANAVKVSWKTAPEKEGGDSVAHDVMSDFGLAAVAVKPLSYTFAEGMNKTEFWGIDKAYSLVNKLTGELKDFSKQLTAQFPHFEVALPKIENIEIVELSEELKGKFVQTVKFDTTIVVENVVTVPDGYNASYNEAKGTLTIPGQTVEVHKDGALPSDPDYVLGSATTPETVYNVKDKKVKDNGDGTWTITDSFTIKYEQTIDMRAAVEELYGNMTGSMEDVNAMLTDLKRFLDEDLKTILDQINGMGGQFESSMNDAIDKVNGKLTQLVDKVNSALCKFVNNFNAALQPVMFAQPSENDFLMVSRAENAPSVYGSKFVLVPSSFSGEYLAPAAQKYVAVTNVIKGEKSAANGDADCKAMVKETNEGNADLNKVLEGGCHAVAVENLKAGYTYEFTYSAVDFYGKVANTKCYVTVK